MDVDGPVGNVPHPASARRRSHPGPLTTASTPCSPRCWCRCRWGRAGTASCLHAGSSTATAEGSAGCWGNAPKSISCGSCRQHQRPREHPYPHPLPPAQTRLLESSCPAGSSGRPGRCPSTVPRGRWSSRSRRRWCLQQIRKKQGQRRRVSGSGGSGGSRRQHRQPCLCCTCGAGRHKGAWTPSWVSSPHAQGSLNATRSAVACYAAHANAALATLGMPCCARLPGSARTACTRLRPAAAFQSPPHTAHAGRAGQAGGSRGVLASRVRRVRCCEAGALQQTHQRLAPQGPPPASSSNIKTEATCVGGLEKGTD